MDVEEKKQDQEEREIAQFRQELHARDIDQGEDDDGGGRYADSIQDNDGVEGVSEVCEPRDAEVERGQNMKVDDDGGGVEEPGINEDNQVSGSARRVEGAGGPLVLIRVINLDKNCLVSPLPSLSIIPCVIFMLPMRTGNLSVHVRL